MYLHFSSFSRRWEQPLISDPLLDRADNCCNQAITLTIPQIGRLLPITCAIDNPDIVREAICRKLLWLSVTV